MSPNLRAFLDMLAFSEGTARVPNSDNGYKALVGGGTFDSYADHPRQEVWIARYGIVSTAAGRYQLLARYYDAYKKLLNLPNFTPDCQDAIAIQQIRERRALPLIESGDFSAAIDRVSNIWASLPGANYGQHEQKIADLERAYKAAGGVVA